MRLQAVGKLKGGFEMMLVFYKKDKWHWKQFAKIPYLDVPTVNLLFADTDRKIGGILAGK